MNIRRRGSSCFVRREDERDPGPQGPAAAETKAAADGAPEQPDFSNSPLPPAMLAVAKDDSPQNRQILYQSMLETWFVVPTREEATAKPGFSGVPANVAGSFSLEHDSDGMLVAVAFTDEEALRNWNKTIPWIALQGNAFFQAVASTEAEEIVINPYELEDPNSKMIRPGGRMKRWEFEALAESRIPQKDSNEQQTEPQSVLVTMPKQMPTPEMFDALSAATRKHNDVVALYFAQVIYPDGEPHWAVAVEFDPASSVKRNKVTMSALTKEARRILSNTITSDLVPASTALGQSMTTTGKKFYSVDATAQKTHH